MKKQFIYYIIISLGVFSVVWYAHSQWSGIKIPLNQSAENIQPIKSEPKVKTDTNVKNEESTLSPIQKKNDIKTVHTVISDNAWAAMFFGTTTITGVFYEDPLEENGVCVEVMSTEKMGDIRNIDNEDGGENLCLHEKGEAPQPRTIFKSPNIHTIIIKDYTECNRPIGCENYAELVEIIK